MRKAWVFLFLAGLAMSISAQDIFDAAINGDLDQVQRLVEKANVSVDALDSASSSALFWAVRDNGSNQDPQESTKKRNAVIAYLIKKGAHLDVVNVDGFTPLLFAIDRGNAEATRLFLEGGANYTRILKIDRKAVTPFDWAIAKIYNSLENYLNYNLIGSALALKALCDYDLSHGHKLNYSKYSDNDLVAVICDDLPRLKTIVSKSGDLANGPYLSFWFQKKDILDWLNDIGQFDPNKKPSCGILKKSRDGTYFDWADQNTDPTMKEYLSKFTKKELSSQ